MHFDFILRQASFNNVDQLYKNLVRPFFQVQNGAQAISKNPQFNKMSQVVSIQQINYIQRRIQKQTKYDPIATMMMELLKKHNLYKKSKILEKQQELKPRNYVVLFFRLFVLESELLKNGWSKQSIKNQIFLYFRNNLDRILHKKYSQNNSSLLISKTKQKNLNDIKVMEDLFLLEDNSLQLVHQILRKLFKIQKYVNLDYNSKKTMKTILHYLQIFRTPRCQQEKQQQNLVHQNNTMMGDDSSVQDQGQIINDIFQSDSCMLDQENPHEKWYFLNVNQESNFFVPDTQIVQAI